MPAGGSGRLVGAGFGALPGQPVGGEQGSRGRPAGDGIRPPRALLASSASPDRLADKRGESLIGFSPLFISIANQLYTTLVFSHCNSGELRLLAQNRRPKNSELKTET